MHAIVSTVNKTVSLSGDLTSKAGTAYLITLFIAGFLTNFIPLIDFGTGTVVLFSLAFFLSMLSLLQLLNPLPTLVRLAAFATFAVTCLVVLKAALDVNPVSQRVQELTIYLLGGWPFLFFIQVDDSRTRERFIRTITVGLFCLCAFGIIQGILGKSLPESLFQLRGENYFAFREDQVRPTGLAGNPVIFSSILIFASALFFAQWVERPRFRWLLALLCSLVANYMTYTRASLFLLIPVFAVVWLFHHRFRLKQIMIAMAGVVLILATSAFLALNAQNLFIVQRMLGSGEDALGSTLSHFVTIQNAWATIATHPLAGVGIGSQGNSVGPENVIITDGAWWILLLEFGIPLSVLLVLLLLLVLIPIARHVLRKHSKDRALGTATLAFHAYLFPASFINSGILGHVCFGLYWAVLGLSLAAAASDRSGGRSNIVTL